MPAKNKKILVHSCCAACASFVAMELEKDGYEVALFFYNPNFNHLDYHYRLTGIKALSKLRGSELILPDYDETEYQKLIAPFHDKNSIKHISDKERFARKAREIMMNLLLKITAQKAKKLNLGIATTSMLCSPYRDHNTVWDVGNSFAEEEGVHFYYKDFRKGYWMGRNFARKYGLAIPAYCSDYME